LFAGQPESQKERPEVEAGQKDLKSKQEFYAAVREQFPFVTEKQAATDKGRLRCWVGLRRVN
jgi:hypothetical protein